MASNSRQHQRFACQLDIYQDNGVFLGQATNISRSGIFLALAENTCLSDQLFHRLRLELRGEDKISVTALAQVRWTDPAKEGHGLELTATRPEAFSEILLLAAKGGS